MGQSDTTAFNPILPSLLYGQSILDLEHANSIRLSVDGVTIDEGYPGTSLVDLPSHD
jgi:hypothetical protein